MGWLSSIRSLCTVKSVACLAYSAQSIPIIYHIGPLCEKFIGDGMRKLAGRDPILKEVVTTKKSLDRAGRKDYDAIVSRLANSSIITENPKTMKTKLIASTEAQNNFGRVLDDVVQNRTRYIVRRRNISQAIIMSVTDLERLLSGEREEREKLERIVREARPTYSIGDTISDLE
jgi:PHD/YefM family antitoxin component YafN of YafNO toxin-antitoxin module